MVRGSGFKVITPYLAKRSLNTVGFWILRKGQTLNSETLKFTSTTQVPLNGALMVLNSGYLGYNGG